MRRSLHLSASRRSSRRPSGRARLERLVEEAIVDAYGESEERCGLFTMIEERLALPFETEVLGVRVAVERIDLTEADEVEHGATSGYLTISRGIPLARPA